MGVPSKCDGAPMRFFWGCHNRPSEAHCSRFTVSKLRSAMPSLAWSFSRYAISDGGFGWTGRWLWRGVVLVFYDVIALGGEVLFCAGF